MKEKESRHFLLLTAVFIINARGNHCKFYHIQLKSNRYHRLLFYLRGHLHPLYYKHIRNFMNPLKITLWLFLLFLFHQGMALSIQHNSFQYDNEYQDSESHLLYLKARYLKQDLQIAYFLSRDYGKAREHKTLFDGDYNAFADNPIMNEDPSGHMRIPGGKNTIINPLSILSEEEVITPEIDPSLSEALELLDLLKTLEKVNQETMAKFRFSASALDYLDERNSSEYRNYFTAERKASYLSWFKEGTHDELWEIYQQKIRGSTVLKERYDAMLHYRLANCRDMAKYNQYQFDKIFKERKWNYIPAIYSSNLENHAVTVILNKAREPLYIVDSWLGRITPYAERAIYYQKGYAIERFDGDNVPANMYDN